MQLPTISHLEAKVEQLYIQLQLHDFLKGDTRQEAVCEQSFYASLKSSTKKTTLLQLSHILINVIP